MTSLIKLRYCKSEAQRAATRENVIAGAGLTGAYMAMNAAAALIASFGLLQNSPAVIIGAMLIAMLYGPIVGIALGLAEASTSLLGRSLLSEISGATWVWIIGYVVGVATPGITIGSEILSRTAPNILDLLIALVGGLAGGFTYLSGGFAGVIVGVAIATALVPPLASCGILFARHLPGLAAGAFLLFLANLTAIAIGAMIIFWLSGHRKPAAELTRKILVPRTISLVLLAVLGAHMTVTLHRTITQSALESAIRRTLSAEVAKIPGARFVTITLAQRRGMTFGWAVVNAPQPISPEQVGRLNDMLERTTGSSVVLYVRTVITAETSREGYTYEPRLSPLDEP
jgi:uncharacterized hydrophobic protein (TIGR00271 family)